MITQSSLPAVGRRNCWPFTPTRGSRRTGKAWMDGLGLGQVECVPRVPEILDPMHGMAFFVSQWLRLSAGPDNPAGEEKAR